MKIGWNTIDFLKLIWFINLERNNTKDTYFAHETRVYIDPDLRSFDQGQGHIIIILAFIQKTQEWGITAHTVWVEGSQLKLEVRIS